MIKKCKLTTLIATALLVSLFANCCNCGSSGFNNNKIPYVIPQAKVEVFSKGFRVSIPDDQGIRLFSFHGKINEPIYDVEPGTYSKDIMHKNNGRWTFEDTNTKLKVGDVIYYWLFVERLNLGYRAHGEHIVETIDSSQLSPPQPGTTCKSCSGTTSSQVVFDDETVDSDLGFNRKQTPDPELSSCCKLFLNVSSELASLTHQLDQLKEENKILIELAKKDDFYSRTLKVFGKYPVKYYDTPKDFAQNLVSEKLQLARIKVTEAKTIPDNGVSFKVDTLQDKIRIVLASKEKLKGSNYELVW